MSNKIYKRNSIRFKKINGKGVPLCDYEGKCTNKAYKEVYPDLGKKVKNKGWSYLCKKHFNQEMKRLKNNLLYCGVK